MALLTVSTTARAAGLDIVGVTPTATTGDTFANTGAELLLVNNGSASPITVTIDYVPTADGNAVTDLAVTVAAGVTKAIGPFPPALYNDTGVSGGLVKATCSSVTTVTVKAIKLGSA
jgi:hypothetical protein